MGIGDRFACQGAAQLQAFIQARKAGMDVTPVWNKSNREHSTIHSRPADVRREAEAAVKTMGWSGDYAVDADHIGMSNVDLFMDASDFFTLDVAHLIGQPAAPDALDAFVARQSKYLGATRIPGIERPLEISAAGVAAVARKFLAAAQEAGCLYRHIAKAKGEGAFITEVSMDESDAPQTPVELLFILAALAQEGVPVQTIAPKFTGRFNKGVDYVGDLDLFSREFDADLAVIALAVGEFGLPPNLKLSIHSGSDKFSLYAPIRQAIRKWNAGLHLKTAGTTWLEELIGLALAGGDGLVIAKEIYRDALGRFDELCAPYAAVIDIRKEKLPPSLAVAGWSGAEYAAALRHDQSCKAFNPDFRQLLHVGYKIAAEMGDRYLEALRRCEDSVAPCVTGNIYDRHLKPLFDINP